MVKGYAASLGTFFTDRKLADRFALAAEGGFQAVELTLPYDVAAVELARARESAALPVVLFTAPLGDFMTGGEGLAGVPGRHQQFRESVDMALEYAEALNSSYVQFVAGRCESTDPRIREQYLATYADNLDYASEAFAGCNTELLIEPINSVKFENFLVDTPAIARQLGSGLSLVFDTVHLALMGLDPVQEWQEHGGAYSHIQLADSPDRTIPGSGTVDFPHLYESINKSDYAGWIGAEYWPANTSEETLQALESAL